MNTFTIEKHGDTQYRLQHADSGGNGTYIICTADELAQLRELLAPMAWQDKPSGEGKYAWQDSNGREDLFDVIAIPNGMIAEGFCRTIQNFDKFGGLWLKLPDVPEIKTA